MSEATATATEPTQAVAATATTATATTATATETTAVAKHWLGDTVDEATLAYVNNKGWTGPDAMLKSYRNLEQLKGIDPARVIELPASTDADAVGKVFEKLGKPADKTGYKFPEGIEPEKGAWFTDVAHNNHLTETQFNAVTSAFIERQKAEIAETVAAQEKARAADIEALRKEWGTAFDAKTKAAEAIAERLGFTKEQVEALAWAGGYKKAVQTLAQVAEKLGETAFVGKPTDGQTAIMTPDQAKLELNRLKGSADFKAMLRDPRSIQGQALQKQYLTLTRLAAGLPIDDIR